MLIENDWKFEFYGLDENNNGLIDESENAMQECEADDILIFNVGGSGLLNRGITICSQGETTTSNFSWNFYNNETELAIFASPEKISILNENTLEVYYMDQNLQGQSVKYIRRFRHWFYPISLEISNRPFLYDWKRDNYKSFEGLNHFLHSVCQ